MTIKNTTTRRKNKHSMPHERRERGKCIAACTVAWTDREGLARCFVQNDTIILHYQALLFLVAENYKIHFSVSFLHFCHTLFKTFLKPSHDSTTHRSTHNILSPIQWYSNCHPSEYLQWRHHLHQMQQLM
jgi:hypothetical protein